ncbi:hypothetical protein [Dictyobacter kobayashii]|uniref:3-keto-disaccharide hydrolase domain-containing protein n=1 Tax=Dictyobacter kobayashii TaxID=2014872 RepID=A0A402AFH0_9CHLR|nr:hypothetical protein [Dictyobacter kobayashii]GCE17858.1 hypothetical protein KDK_16580 [Dictyobacter kobayashii]
MGIDRAAIFPATTAVATIPGNAGAGVPPQPNPPSWNELATQAFQSAQQPWNEAATQGFQSSPVQQPANPATQSTRRTPTGQLGPGASMFNNPMFPKKNSQQLGNAGTQNYDIQTGPNAPVNGSPSGMHPNATRNLGNSGIYPSPAGNAGNSSMFNNPTGALGSSGIHPNATRNLGNTGMLPSPTGALGNTGALMHPAGEYSGDTGMLKLNQAVKVVRIPVAGKPGEYKTGILPVLAQGQGNTGALPPPTPPQNLSFQDKIKKNSKLVVLAALIVLVLFSSGIYLLTRSGGTTASQTNTGNNKHAQVQANLNATATANVQATATFNDSVLISDPLSSNSYNWLLRRPDQLKLGMDRQFKNNAYHISSTKVGDNTYFASSVLISEIPPAKYTYSVDMQQVKGADNNTDFNFFGLVFSYHEINGKALLYAFRIVNNKDGVRYEFCLLDGRKATGQWSDPIWKASAGKEFHGTKGKNNLKVHVDGSHFTFSVNGKQMGTAQNNAFGPGSIGLGVNGLDGGSEVAFTNLLLTKI